MRITAGKINRPQKGVIYGCEGVGKSTFASKFPKPIFADLEGGTAHLDVQRADISSWEELLATIDELSKDSNGFKTFIMDTADWAERMCAAFLCKKYKKTGIEDFGYGKGYQYLAEEFAGMLGKLTALQNSGMHVVLLAHSTIRKLELPEETGSYDHYELKCSKTVSPLVKEWADGLLFANYRTTVIANSDGKGKAVGGKERVLYTEHTAFCDAKNRWGLSGILPLSFESVAGIFGIPELSSATENESETFGNVEITDTRKANITLIETSMEFSGVSEAELNDYLRGNNSKKKVFISKEQTFRDLSDSWLEKISAEDAWEKIESQIVAGRAK